MTGQRNQAIALVRTAAAHLRATPPDTPLTDEVLAALAELLERIAEFGDQSGVRGPQPPVLDLCRAITAECPQCATAEVAAVPDPAGPASAGGGVTTDPSDPRLTHGADAADGGPVDQAPVYLVLSPEQRAQGFVRPLRLSYWHTRCGAVTRMSPVIAETYARQPNFYVSTYCTTCRQHRPVGADGEFHWVDPDRPGQQSPTRDPKVGV